MKKLLSIVLGVLSLAVFVMPSAYAVTWEAAENVVVRQNILDDSYIVGGNVAIEASIFGDLYVIGGSVVINGDIHEDLVVIGGRVTTTGEVMGDMRVIGGQVAVYGNVGDDIVVAGGQVDVGKSAVVGGSVIAGSGVLTVDGEVLEDIRGALGMLILNGTVGHDVIVTIEDTMSIADDAKIKRNLKYSALLEGSVPDGVVKGEVSFNKFERETVLETVTYASFIQKGLSFLSALFLLAIFVISVPKSLISGAKLAKQNVPKAFGIGLLAVIVAVIGALILTITIVGIPLGLIMLGLFLIVMYISKIFVAAWASSYVLNFRKKNSKWKIFGVMAGALLLYYILGMIPFVGWIINLVLFLIGVGILVQLKIVYYKFLKTKNMV